MPRDYFRGMGACGPEGNFAQRREWPSVWQTVLYAGKPVRVLKIVKRDCVADIAGDSLPYGTARVGLDWLLQPNDNSADVIVSKMETVGIVHMTPNAGIHRAAEGRPVE